MIPEELVSSIRPETQDKYLGIEIEFMSPHGFESIAETLIKENLAKYVTLKDDCSIDYSDGSCDCHPNEWWVHGEEGSDDSSCECCGTMDSGVYTHELCVLVKQSQVKRIMAKLSKVFKKCEAFTNSSCGLHVHIDSRNRDPHKTFANLVAAQDVLYGLAKPGRKSNRFCLPLNNSASFMNRPSGRYVGINGESYQYMKTIEVRLYHGTIDTKEITGWSKLLVAIADAKKTKHLDMKGVKKMIKSKDVKTYINSRIRNRKKIA